nr:DUF2807 domain-containing protein [uncultured Carboxylicivirga sp.]
MKKFSFILFAFFICTSCEYINFLNKEGSMVEYNYNVGKIKYLIADASYRIILTNSSSQTINISGYDYLTDGIIFEENGDTLRIDNDHYFIQKSKLPEITIGGSSLNNITLNAVCQINCIENIETNQLRLTMNGGSQYTESDLDLTCQNLSLAVYGLNNVGTHIIKGTVENVSYILEGSVNLDALDLISQKTNVIHKSIGYCKVNVINELNVNTYSTGNTYYIGNPAIQHQHIELPYFTSTGEVIKIH